MLVAFPGRRFARFVQIYESHRLIASKIDRLQPLIAKAMSVFGGFVKAGVSFCQSTVILLQTARHISTGVCCRIRMDSVPPLKTVDRWTEKRSMYGVYDNIGILGDFKAHPRDLIVGPVWLRGFQGNELQRLIRKKKMVGDRMMTLDRHNMEKRIRFLYRHLNRYGKHR